MLNLSVENCEGFYSKKYQDHVPCSFTYKRFCLDDKFTKTIVVFGGENAAYEFIRAILKEYEYYKKVMKKTLWQKFDHEGKRRRTISIK